MEKSLQRLNLIKNHLTSKRINTLDSYRKLSTFNKGALYELYYPAHHDVRNLVMKIIVEHPNIFK